MSTVSTATSVSRPFYVSTSIPYVNGAPHLGHALEFVQADVLARHARRTGHDVFALTGTDDNSLKNVLAAREAGVTTAELVDRNAARFAALRDPLELSFDDFLRTSTDPRHLPAVERLWRACEASGDLYRKAYEGLYCVGCEQFYEPAELPGGRCPEHGTEPDLVSEENWFFRLSRYADALAERIESGALRIEPAQRRNEVLGLIRNSGGSGGRSHPGLGSGGRAPRGHGLNDFSVSRSAARAGGWGIPVPGDPDQVVYVWFDALVNYISALGYGASEPGYERWWRHGHRSHVIGKGILRFHAVYWPAMLLSAGQPLPDAVLVHDYLTVDGVKISKSAGNAADPADLVGRYGVDAVRWWLLSEVPKVGDVDFTVDRLVARYNTDLAGGLGNLVNRTVGLVDRLRDGRQPDAPLESFVDDLLTGVDRDLAAGLASFDFRRATDAIRRAVGEGNRFVETAEPWKETDPARTDVVLATLSALCRGLAGLVAPLLPSGSARLLARLDGATEAPFPRL